jgi:response regulator of citrate/malate metabolism
LENKVIQTLVIDDDFRVAQIHADRLARVDGFQCVGLAYTAATARAAIAELRPDLLLLDLYLPDEDGLSLLRSLQTSAPAPDCIVITAARDRKTVRVAMQSGAFYYLVKPFGFEQFRHELTAYKEWRKQLTEEGVADQTTVDSLYDVRRSQNPDAIRRQLPPTMHKVLNQVRSTTQAVSAAEVAAQLGMSRPTAQRYLSELEHKGIIELQLAYGSAGRPINFYVLRRGH